MSASRLWATGPGTCRNVFGGIGDLGANVGTSVGSRLAGNSPTHLLALHVKVLLGAVDPGAGRDRFACAAEGRGWTIVSFSSSSWYPSC